MFRVAQLMTRHVLSIPDDAPIGKADEMLELRRIRHLPVVRGGKLVGLMTFRELARAYDPAGSTRPVTVRDAMAAPVTTVGEETSLLEAIQLMLQNHFGCLPVVRADGTLLGIVTEADLLRVAADKVAEIDRRDLAAEYEE